MACLTHCIFNLQQDAIVAVCSSPSLHLSEMGMAPFTARCNRRCLLIAIAPFAACIATVNALWPIQIGTVGWDRHCRFGSRGWEFDVAPLVVSSARPSNGNTLCVADTRGIGGCLSRRRRLADICSGSTLRAVPNITRDLVSSAMSWRTATWPHHYEFIVRCGIEQSRIVFVPAEHANVVEISYRPIFLHRGVVSYSLFVV